MCVAPCSWRTRINLIFESTSASKIGIAAPPDSPKTYSTPSRSRQRISASAPVCALVTGAGLAGEGGTGVRGREAGADGTSEPRFRKEGRRSYVDLATSSSDTGINSANARRFTLNDAVPAIVVAEMMPIWLTGRGYVDAGRRAIQSVLPASRRGNGAQRLTRSALNPAAASKVWMASSG